MQIIFDFARRAGFTCCLGLLLSFSSGAQAQPEFSAWRFGDRGGLQFVPGSPAALPVGVLGGAFVSPEACAAWADSAGALLCSASGVVVRDRRDQPMPNGFLSGSSFSAAQGVLLLADPNPSPGAATRLHLFTVDAIENQLAGGLRHSVVDLSLRGGLGDVLLPNCQRITPPGYRLTEALTAVRHANGTDYWVLVHGVDTDEFLAYHLPAGGPAPGPVRSAAGRPHPTLAGPAVLLRAAPDGRTLAAGVPGFGVELFDFDNATGRVGNPRRAALPAALSAPYGLEFSPDNAKLYVSEAVLGLYQLDLLTNALAVRLAAGVPAGGGAFGLQRGPDGRIYVAQAGAGAVGCILTPNRAGTACNYQPAAVPLPGGFGFLGLPNLPNALAQRPVQLLASAAVCDGQLVDFRAQSGPAGAVFAWDFGEPAAGPANRAQGRAVQHRYAGSGTYQVQLTATPPAGGQLVTATHRLEVEPPAALLFAPLDTTQRCLPEPATLRLTGHRPNSTFVWSDGLTTSEPSRPAPAPGRYTVVASSPAGCRATASIEVPTIRICTVEIPNVITPNADGFNDFFAPRNLPNPAAWSLVVFNRWGRGVFRQAGYDNHWSAAGQPAGTYFYLLQNGASGQRFKGWVEVVR